MTINLFQFKYLLRVYTKFKKCFHNVQDFLFLIVKLFSVWEEKISRSGPLSSACLSSQNSDHQ